MPKQRPSQKHNRPKKYDFETPLDPFQGESLKGIAAFIESSLTLQPETKVEELTEESLTPVSSKPSTLVTGTLDTGIIGTPITDEISTLASDESSVLNSGVSSVPITLVPSIPITNSEPHRDGQPAELIPSTLSTPRTVPGAPGVFSPSFPDRSQLSVLDTARMANHVAVTPTPGSPERVIQLNIRTAARGQDGLNKGEQKIYTFLWRAVYRPKEMGKSEFKTTTDTIEISLRDLAKRVDLGLANCAWHMRCLEEKGCIVRVRESDHYRPAVYRVREFGEILQWRKNRGLTHFIQRGHLAAFVDPRIGTPITRFRGQTGTVYRGKVIMSTPDTGDAGMPSTAELSTPDTGVGTANSSTHAVLDSSTEGVSDLSTPVLKERGLTEEPFNLTAASFLLPPPELIAGLHQLLPVFDNEAVTILWNDCRSKAVDCTVEEVLHFSEAKAASFRTGKIQNPTGFLLVTVPKCFEGQAFTAFREQETKRRAEQQRREEQELEKAQMLEKELRVEQETFRQAEEKLASLPAEQYQALFQQKRTEYLAMFPKTRSWKPETLDESIRARIVREFQKEILRNRP